MPITPTYPGVYIEEVPSGVHTITGVATAITAFIGRAKKGSLDEPILIHSFADYDRKFGGLWDKSTMSYAVQQYFLHGGKDSLIVRVFNPTASASKATISLPSANNPLVLEAANEGEWGNALETAIDYDTKDKKETTPALFNLTVWELKARRELPSAPPSSENIVSAEVFRNLSMDKDNPRFITKVLEQQSGMVRVSGTPPTDRPNETAFTQSDSGGHDGEDISDTQFTGTTGKGINALDTADLFNILCIPPRSKDLPIELETFRKAAAYCKNRRAMLIVDPFIQINGTAVKWADVGAAADANTGIDGIHASIGDASTNAVVYFPMLKMADPLKENRTEEFAPCGAIAGIWARTDAQRGVWKAPAGQEASFSGVREFTCKLDDNQNGTLNPLGLNCLRSFPVYGNLVWGARTLDGADQLASEWKYIPVRRTALYIEESLYRGSKWIIFEPNDEPLWAQIRLNFGAFMHNLFRQGAFQGITPREAYFVKCDKETTTQNDVDRGIVNIFVGFAPLKPAEFVMIKLSQIAGQVQA